MSCDPDTLLDWAVTAFVWIFVLSFLALVLVGIGGSMGWIK